MLSYPLTIGVDAGSLLVTSPDFPELTTLGDDLDEAIAARMHSRLDMPAPSHGGYGGAYATLRSLPVVKVMLYQGGACATRRSIKRSWFADWDGNCPRLIACSTSSIARSWISSMRPWPRSGCSSM